MKKNRSTTQPNSETFNFQQCKKKTPISMKLGKHRIEKRRGKIIGKIKTSAKKCMPQNLLRNFEFRPALEGQSATRPCHENRIKVQRGGVTR